MLPDVELQRIERALTRSAAHSELLLEFVRENRRIYETLAAKPVMTLEEKLIGSILERLLSKAKEAA